MNYKAIVIGSSAGGMNALKQILPLLPKNFSMPLILVQHLSAHSDSYWIKMFGDICQLTVKEADEKEKIQQGYIYTAPPNYHLLVEKDKTFALSIDAKVNFSRPSIDVLFESAALTYKEQLIGIILTGANSDGTAGMKKIKEYGGLTIAQNPMTAESPTMPLSAIEALAVDHILSLEGIKHLLIQLSESQSIHSNSSK